MTSERDQLKQILLKEELATLETLKKRMLDKQAFTEQVSQVLADATGDALQKDDRYQSQLAQPIAMGFDEAIEHNKDAIISSFTPIIGSIIRQSISTAMRRFVADINRAVELGFSAKAVRWRWQAIRTGVPFAEIVFNNTIAYEIQQLFLIDHQTGLLIEHAGQEQALLKDKDALSAMLTAIQDFVNDSMVEGKSGLSAAEMGENLIWIITGQHAYLAAVIKGAPTGRLREKLTVFTEQTHAQFAHVIENQESWRNTPQLKNALQEQLVTKSLTEIDGDEDKTRKKVNFLPWLIILLLATGIIAYWQFHSYKKTQLIRQTLESTPGLYVQSLEKSGDGYKVSGLLDPLAQLDGLEQVHFNTKPFYSLEPEILKQRIVNLAAKEQLGLSFDNIQIVDGKVTLTGNEGLIINESLLKAMSELPGIETLDNQIKKPLNLSGFLEQHPSPFGLKITINDEGEPLLEGLVKTDSFDEWLNHFKLAGFEFDASAVQYVASEKALIEKVNQQFVVLSSPNELNLVEKQHIELIFSTSLQLLQYYNKQGLSVESKSDCYGSIRDSNKYNQQRKTLIENYASQQFPQLDSIQFSAQKCDRLVAERDLQKIGIAFSWRTL